MTWLLSPAESDRRCLVSKVQLSVFGCSCLILYVSVLISMIIQRVTRTKGGPVGQGLLVKKQKLRL